MSWMFMVGLDSLNLAANTVLSSLLLMSNSSVPIFLVSSG